MPKPTAAAVTAATDEVAGTIHPVKYDPHQPYPVDLSGSNDVALIAAGVGQYLKHLETLKEGAAKLKRTRDTERYAKEIEGLETELTERLAGGDALCIYPRHLPVIARGLEFVAKNAKAAKGTLAGLGSWTAEWVEKLDFIASYVEGSLLQKFEPQLKLEKV